MIPDTFFAGFLVAFLILEVVRPFLTGFVRGIKRYFSKEVAKPPFPDAFHRLTEYLYGRIISVRQVVKRALEFDETNPPNERFNFPARIILEEVVERLELPFPSPKDNPCQNCGGDGLAACPACHGDGEQPDAPTPVPVPVDLPLKMPEHIDTPVLMTCDRCGGKGVEPGTETEKCSTCKGRGQAFGAIREKFTEPSGPCPLCDGSGQERFEVMGKSTPQREPCPRCNGTGRA